MIYINELSRSSHSANFKLNMVRDNGTKEQLVVALNLYWKIPYNKISGSTNPLIFDIANIIKRTPAALAYKLMNFTSLDGEKQKIGNKGKSASSAADKEVWTEYLEKWEKLAHDSTLILANIQNKTIEQVAEIESEFEFGEGKEEARVVKARINQGDFRRRVLASYNERCCITNISIPSLLVASHIVPWSRSKEERLNPRNGLCLNNIHDKAFDRGLITISTDYKIILSDYLIQRKSDANIQKYFMAYENKSITLPDRFLPSTDFLTYHNRNIFNQ